MAVSSAVNEYLPPCTKYSLSRSLQDGRHKSDSVLQDCALACPPVLRFCERNRFKYRNTRQDYCLASFSLVPCTLNIAHIFLLVNRKVIKISKKLSNYIDKLCNINKIPRFVYKKMTVDLFLPS